MTNASVYVTGSSVLTAAGVGTAEVWESIRDKKVVRSTREFAFSDGTTLSFPVYPMPRLNLRDWVDDSTYTWICETGLHLDQDFVYLVIAAKMAIQDAKVLIRPDNRISLIIGHENLGINHLINRIISPEGATLETNVFTSDPLTSYQDYRNHFFMLQTFPYLFYLAKVLGVRGLTLTLNNACASGLYALEMGRMLIETKQSDTVIVVSSDYAHITEHLWLSEKGFSSKEEELRPFDKRRDGSILGDGASAIVLESAESTELRSADIHAKYLGGKYKQDLWQLNLPDVAEHSYRDVIVEAHQAFAREGIDLLIPHGAGIPLWDLYEAKEITRAFQELQQPLPDITAFKGYIGHTLGANSLIESVLLIEVMKQNGVPVTQNYEEPDSKFSLPISTKFKRKTIKKAMKTVTAYGGFHAACVFEKVE